MVDISLTVSNDLFNIIFTIPIRFLHLQMFRKSTTCSMLGGLQCIIVTLEIAGHN